MAQGQSQRPGWLDGMLDAAAETNSWIVNSILMVLIIGSSILVTLLVGRGCGPPSGSRRSRITG